MNNINSLLKQYSINYYTKDEIGYRLPSDIKIDSFWTAILEFRQSRGETMPFKDQNNKPFWFMLSPILQETLHLIDSRGKDSLYRAVQDEIRDELVDQALVEEAMFSSVIEGAFSTVARARELIVEGRKPKDKSDQMVANNGRAMRFIFENKDRPCSLDFLHDLQKLVTDKTIDEKDSGYFRDDLVYVYSESGKLVYTAPPADTVHPSMQALVDWINADREATFIHPVVRAIIIHTYFVYVHPYFDGNGRTARSLFYWYLLKNDYEFFRYFSISSIIQESRGQYYKSLRDMEENEADMTYVLLYMSGTVIRAIQTVMERITERYRRNLLFDAIAKKGLLLNDRQKRFLKHLAVSKDKRGLISKYQKDFNVVYQTARADLIKLEEIGILKKSKQGRKFAYAINPGFWQE